MEDVEEIEDLFPDVVRLGTAAGDLDMARSVAEHAAVLAAGSEIPHRQANALYCSALLEHDQCRLLEAADRYADAGRPLLRAKALEAAAGEFLRADDRDRARAAFTSAVDVYTSLGAAADTARRHPAGAALQAPAGEQRVGQPHADRDQDRLVRGGGAV
jgi:hypothetical protein